MTKARGATSPKVDRDRSRKSLPIQIRPCRRQAAWPPRPLGCDRLEDLRRGALEGDRAAGEIKQPEPRLRLAHFGDRLVETCLQALGPQAAGARIMLAQILHV